MRDRTRSPRKWWYPVIPELHADEQQAREFHAQLSQTIWRTTALLVAASVYCAVALGRPDRSMLLAEEVQLPILSTPISYGGFLIVAPLIVIVVSVYLHIYIRQWRRLEGVAELERAALLFNLGSPTARVLSYLAFYWTAPVVLFLFARKAAPYPIQGFLLAATATIFTTALIWTHIAMASDEFRRRRHHVLQWLTLAICPVFIGVASPRTWNLAEADLSATTLSRLDLRAANLTRADLTSSRLEYLDLRRADLSHANLSGATLEAVSLQGAVITDATIDLTDPAFDEVTPVTCEDRVLLLLRPEDGGEPMCPGERTWFLLLPAFIGMFWPVRQFGRLVRDVYAGSI